MNQFLLDTHTALWFFNDDPNLSKQAKEIIEDPESRCFISMASVWEVAIKISINKLTFPQNTTGFIREIEKNNFELCGIETEHILEIEKLPFIHRDPFDRLIVTTSIVKDIPILTIDDNIVKYPVKCIW